MRSHEFESHLVGPMIPLAKFGFRLRNELLKRTCNWRLSVSTNQSEPWTPSSEGKEEKGNQRGLQHRSCYFWRIFILLFLGFFFSPGSSEYFVVFSGQVSPF